MSRILIIERNDHTRALLQCRLPAQLKVKFAPSIEAASEKLCKHKYDLIVWNACADSAGSDLTSTLDFLSEKTLGARTLVFTAREMTYATVPCGTHIDIKKHPNSDDEFLSLIENHLPVASYGAPKNGAYEETGVPIEFEGMITVGLTMRPVIRRIIDAAAVDIPVLIAGETGTGKDLVAAAIHRQSARKARPYVAVNMGAMAPELIASEIFGHERGAFTGAQDSRPGIFEQANGGTVFLDEIATMDEKTQVSLLRVLEEKTVRRVGGAKNIGVDVRIIAASNEDLEKRVAAKGFREDLFYRLNVFHIKMPPLRDRPGAVTVLTDHFLSQYAAIYGKDVERVSHETYRLLRHYPWPGNVRELKNVIQAAVLMVDGKELTPEFIPERIRESTPIAENSSESVCSIRLGATLDSVEKELIRMTLTHVRGNKKLAASILGISRRALYNKLKRHHLFCLCTLCAQALVS
ncbi:MAG: sigma-54 interaction domain-containing protein [Betaproteobacteria bacterium]